MKIVDYIRNIFANDKDNHILRRGGMVSFVDITKEKFGDSLYFGILSMLTTIYSEVTWTNKGDINSSKYRAWETFMRYNGERILNQLLFKSAGYVVIGYNMSNGEYRFWEMKSTEYSVTQDADGNSVVSVTTPDIYFYVLKSPTYDAVGMSDYQLARPYIKYIDNVFNASNTTCERLGAMVVGAPSTPSGANIASVLNKRDKEELEKEISENYGALKKQKQFMLLPQDMHFTTINLASIDTRLQERVLNAAKIIADLLHVPANQIAVVDASGGRSLSNGTELREGEVQKYRSFRRLCNIFYDFATEIGLKVDYTIENEPKTIQGQTIEN